MARLSGLCIFALLFASAFGVKPTLTGDAAYDFAHLTEEQKRTSVTVVNTQAISVSDWMRDHNQTSGWDLNTLSMQYDYVSDTLTVGVDCFVICGDSDGDGNPSSSSDRGNEYDGPDAPVNVDILDTHLQEDYEAIIIMLWTGAPHDFVPSTVDGQQWKGFRPDIVIGDSRVGSLANFNAYGYDYEAICNDAGLEPETEDCDNYFASTLYDPSGSFDDTTTYKQLAASTGKRPVDDAYLFGYPNSTHPDVEFQLGKFSNYGQNDFVPGLERINIVIGAYLGSTQDSCGEERQFPTVLTIDCQIQDACGVCGGDNTSCDDCFGIPRGNSTYDVCGICGGDGKSCLDCFGVPYGGKEVDECNVCGGNNACLDCFGTPHGNEKYDDCGVCGGLDECKDCEGVAYGKKEYDNCGVCGGDGTSCIVCPQRSDLVFTGEDTWIEIADRLATHGNDGYLQVKHNRSRALVQFRDVTSSILQEHKFINSDQPTVILGAWLQLTIAQAKWAWEDQGLAIHRIETFDEKTATWDCSSYDLEGCCQQWRMIGLPPQVVPSYNTEPSGVTNIHTGQRGVVEFDVTAEVTALVAAGDQSVLGYLIKKVCEHDAGFVSFHSAESDIVIAPKLLVSIQTHCHSPPTPPTPVEPCPDPQRDNGDWSQW